MMTLMAATKNKTAQKSSDPNEEAKELSALLEKAMEQPGVKEVMEVYGDWAKPNEVATTFQAYQNPYPPNTVSSSSEPV
jgi:hypothetical protein